MKPLDQYEMIALIDAMGGEGGQTPVPRGSLWTMNGITDLYMVLLHTNLPNGEHGIVFQVIPSGISVVVPTNEFFNGQWINIGFVWDRSLVE